MQHRLDRLVLIIVVTLMCVCLSLYTLSTAQKQLDVQTQHEEDAVAASQKQLVDQTQHEEDAVAASQKKLADQTQHEEDAVAALQKQLAGQTQHEEDAVAASQKKLADQTQHEGDAVAALQKKLADQTQHEDDAVGALQKQLQDLGSSSYPGLRVSLDRPDDSPSNSTGGNNAGCPRYSTPCPRDWLLLLRSQFQISDNRMPTAPTCLAPSSYTGPCGRQEPAFRYMPLKGQQCQADRSWFTCEDPVCSLARTCASNAGLSSCACPSGARIAASNPDGEFSPIAAGIGALLTGKALVSLAENEYGIPGARPPDNCRCIPWAQLVARPTNKGGCGAGQGVEGCTLGTGGGCGTGLGLEGMLKCYNVNGLNQGPFQADTHVCLRPSIRPELVQSPFNAVNAKQMNSLRKGLSSFHKDQPATWPMGGCWCEPSENQNMPEFKSCGCDGVVGYQHGPKTYTHVALTITDERSSLLFSQLLGTLVALLDLLQKLEIRYVVISGTMLGYLRNKDFMPWDDDIDVRVHKDDWHKLGQENRTSNRLEGSKIQRMNRILEWNCQPPIPVSYSQACVSLQVRTPGSGEHAELSAQLDAHIDVVRADHVDNPYWPYAQHMFLEPTQIIQMHGVSFRIPSNRMADISLTQQYGRYMEVPDGGELVCRRNDSEPF